MLFTDELVFTHIPKTGGVAISNVLHRAATYAGKECFGNYPIDAISTEGAVYAWRNAVPWSYTQVHSGIADAHEAGVWKDRKRLGSVRNPWDWYRSWYLYNRKAEDRFAGIVAHIINQYDSPSGMNAVVKRAAHPGLFSRPRTSSIIWPQQAHRKLDYFGACKRMKCGLLTVLSIRVLCEDAYDIIEKGTEKDLAGGLINLFDCDALIPTETLAESVPAVTERFGFAPIKPGDPVVYKGERPNRSGQWQGTPLEKSREKLSKSAIDLIARREKHYIEAFGYTGPGSVPRELVFYRGDGR